MTTATAHLVSEDGVLHEAQAAITTDGRITLDWATLPNGTYNLSLVVFGVRVGDPTPTP